MYLIFPLVLVSEQVRIEGVLSEEGAIGLVMLSWFSISIAYSSELSCGGTVNPLDNKKASREERVP